MHDRGDHYLGNNAWASSGDGVASDNWELAGGRPRPASPALSLVSDRPHNPRAIDGHYQAIRVAMRGVFNELGIAA